MQENYLWHWEINFTTKYNKYIPLMVWGTILRHGNLLNNHSDEVKCKIVKYRDMHLPKSWIENIKTAM